MLRLASYDIVFRDVPGEVTLALNISGCPHRCPGCHSPGLQEETGEPMGEDALAALLGNYGAAVTCVCFMGGDADPGQVGRLAAFVKRDSGGRLKTAWYSGCRRLPEGYDVSHFDYIKLGPYIERLGGLASRETNQRFYRIENGEMIDATGLFLN